MILKLSNCDKQLACLATQFFAVARIDAWARRRSAGARIAVPTLGILLGLSMMAVSGACVSTAMAQTVSFETSSGQVLRFRKVESLSCAELDSVLTEISRANYRSIGSTPPQHPGDRALYDYEDRASRRLARHCGAAPKARGFGRMQNWDFGR